MKLATTSKDGTVSTIGLFHRKANLGPRRPALGYAVTFADAQTRIDRVDVASVDELVTSLPLWQRMKDALKDGPQTLASLAVDLDAPVDSIDKAVRRKSNLFTKVTTLRRPHCADRAGREQAGVVTRTTVRNRVRTCPSTPFGQSDGQRGVFRPPCPVSGVGLGQRGRTASTLPLLAEPASELPESLTRREQKQPTRRSPLHARRTSERPPQAQGTDRVPTRASL